MKITITITMLCFLLASSRAAQNYIEIYSTQPSQTLSATTNAMAAGVYAATNLSQVDTDLAAANIVATSTIFGVAGTIYAPVAKTGQTNTFATRDDGALKIGVTWPTTRFTAQANTNCIKDNLTGLIWAQNANQFGAVTWSNALNDCNTLNYGGQTDWRLPNLKEFQSLFTQQIYGPALPAGHPFGNVQPDNYWTGDTHMNTTANAWFVAVWGGGSSDTAKTGSLFVWPVRGP